jgi:predicted dithiol-disulfide oxidoreductase (DUF899 family)
MTAQEVVSREEWVKVRKELLDEEKEFTRARDLLSVHRGKLRWVKVDKEYVFEGDEGKLTLEELFADKSQLVIYHFMFGPDWEQGCKACSFVCDHIDPARVHLEQRDVMLVAASSAPLSQLLPFKKRMGWNFNWVSSAGCEFNQDFHVTFSREEMETGEVYYNYQMQQFPVEEAPDASFFIRNGSGEVFHTYSCYARGLESLIGTYNILDLVPRGRDEGGLPYPMDWVRHHDNYDGGNE